MPHVRTAALTLCALLASTAFASPARAQTITSPTFGTVDDNGVDLIQGDLVTSFTEGSIGSGEGAMSLIRRLGNISGINTGGFSEWDRIFLQYLPGNGTYVDFGPRNDKFPGAEARGATLTGGGASYQYITPDGTVVAFTNNEPDSTSGDISNLCRSDSTTNCLLLPTSITSPNGKTVTLEYGWWTQCILQTPPGQLPSPDDPVSCAYTPRLKKVSSSFGYAITWSYASDEGGGRNTPPATFYQRTGAQFFNTNVSTTTPQASVSYAFPSTGVTDITDMGGRVWRITNTSSTVAIRRPGASSDTTSYTLSTATSTYGKVLSATREGVTTSYSRVVSGSTATMTVSNALGQRTVVTSNLTVGRPTSVTDALGRATSFQYDTSGRLTRTTHPEGDYVQYTYDARGNVTQTKSVAKAGSGVADIVVTASFPSTCTNTKTCNKPTSSTDARGNTTNYTWNSTHGGMLTVTAPAPATGAVRPQVRYSYTLTNGEYLLTGVSQCQTTASCTGGADEVKTTTSYDSNGNLKSVSSGNGSGTLTATSTMTYDAMGNLITVDGPLSGTADTVKYRYSAARELIGETSPDPDGAGPLKMRAVRRTYTNALLTRIERGTVLSQSDTDWASFSPSQAVDLTYDANARVRTQKLSSGGTAYALTQFSYDGLGRSDCTAVRMNPAIYGSLPSSACTLGAQGSFGPDRIRQTVYDAAGQLVQQKVAVGSTDAATERTLTYSNNGELRTLKDAENNLTTYEYDGHDRLLKTRFPDPTQGAGASSTSDYEQLSYDAQGNVTSLRLRDGRSIGFTFDALNRVTAKDLPGTEPDVSYAYDNLGRLTSASQTGNSLSFTYDALSRNLTQAGPQGTVTSEWDAAGRRTRLTYPGSGLYLNYDYLVTGEATKIRENGATSGIGVLATFGYDDLGRRTSLTFGNGTRQSYTFDAVSRLASLTADLSGTTYDLTIGPMAYNPASQIASQTRSNDNYAWTGHGNGSTAPVANGLNELTSIGGSATSHDACGNLTSDPISGKTYGYSSEKLLTSASGVITLGYDPMLRLYQVAGGSTTRFTYDGLNMIAEYDGSNALQRRFVFGPGMDQPLIQYEGSGTTGRRFFHADERGSIVAVSDGTGAMLAIDRYDEFGKPQSGNSGRFQYTGQAWLPEIGLYYYKARMYAPHLGRFLQTDPIGYRNSPNLYTYVHHDPVNLADPLGLEDAIIISAARIARSFCDANTWLCGSLFSGTTSTPGTGSTGGGGGIGGGGSEIGDSEERQPCSPTQAQLQDSGPVTFVGFSGSAYGLLGGTLTQGTFTTASGIKGNFTTIAFGVGAGVSFTGSSGIFHNLGDFVGGNDNFNVSTPLLDFGFHWNMSGDLAGASGGPGYQSPLTNLLKDVLKDVANPLLLTVATSASITFSSTDITNVTCPVE